jgi:putative YjhG/YagF family dehydratase
MATRSARALVELESKGLTTKDILTDASIRNSMVLHAAFGGSTNLLLHIPAIAFSAGLKRPAVDDWIEVNRQVPRIVDVLPNGPMYHPTVRVFTAGGVPEVMLHLRKLGVLDTKVLTVSGTTLDEVLNWWEQSERRQKFRALLKAQDGIDPNDVIMSPDRARERGLTSTVTFPTGNLCPEGAVIKSTAIDPSVVTEDGLYKKEGPARVFYSELDAINAIKEDKIRSGDIIVLIGCGPQGTGMEETYQVTSALKHLPFGKHVALITDARFSGVSTGACIGHVGPEALAGGPIGKVRDGDIIRIVIDRRRLVGSVNLIGDGSSVFSPEDAATVLETRKVSDRLSAHPMLPEDTRLWAALQQLGGGTWGGCVYDIDKIVDKLRG